MNRPVGEGRCAGALLETAAPVKLNGNLYIIDMSFCRNDRALLRRMRSFVGPRVVPVVRERWAGPTLRFEAISDYEALEIVDAGISCFLDTAATRVG